jgi:hypothetical protein
VNKTALAGALAATALLLAGCGDGSGTGTGSSDASSTGSATGTATGTATSSAAAPSSTGAAPTTSSSAPARPARCTIGGLKVSLGPPEGAAGSTFLPVRLTNTTDKPCRTGGFGGVSLVISPRSEPVGAPADRSQPGTAKPIVLQPGGRAEATLRITEAGNFSAATCRPTPTQGLRVFPPNETHAAYVPHAATACASPKVHLLELRPYQAG